MWVRCGYGGWVWEVRCGVREGRVCGVRCGVWRLGMGGEVWVRRLCEAREGRVCGVRCGCGGWVWGVREVWVWEVRCG